MTDTINPHKAKALELAQQSGGPHAEVVARAVAYHAFLTGAAVAPAGAATTTANKPAGPAAGAKPAGDKAAAPAAGAKGAAAGAPAGGKAADPKAGAGKPADKAPAPGAKANGATAPKPGAAAAPKGGAPNAQSIPADTKAPGGKNTYADVVAMLHKVQNGPAGRPECFKILLEDGGAAKSVRDLKPAFYDAVVEACQNVIEADGAGSAEPAADEDALGDLGAVAGGGEQPDMGV